MFQTAVAVAVFLGGGPLVVAQAATSASLVATAARPATTHLLSFSRFEDALVGAGVGLVVLAAVPRNPLLLTRRATDAVLDELAATLDDIAAALARHDRSACGDALGRARAIDERLRHLHDALPEAHELTVLAPAHWRARTQIERYEDAPVHVE